MKKISDFFFYLKNVLFGCKIFSILNRRVIVMSRRLCFGVVAFPGYFHLYVLSKRRLICDHIPTDVINTYPPFCTIGHFRVP